MGSSKTQVLQNPVLHHIVPSGLSHKAKSRANGSWWTTASWSSPTHSTETTAGPHGWWNGSSPRTSRSVRDVLMGVKMKTRWVCMKVEHPIIMFSCYKKRQRFFYKTQFYRTSSHQLEDIPTHRSWTWKIRQKDQRHTRHPSSISDSIILPSRMV